MGAPYGTRICRELGIDLAIGGLGFSQFRPRVAENAVGILSGSFLQVVSEISLCR